MTAKMTIAQRTRVGTRRITRRMIWLGLVALLLVHTLLPATAYAQREPNAPLLDSAQSLPALHIEETGGALRVQWQSDVQVASLPATTSYGGYLLPLQTLLVELSPEQAAQGALAGIALQNVSSRPYTGELTPAPTYTPPALDYVPTPLNTPYVEESLPTSPIFVMAEGLQRGRHLAVLGFSLIYQDPNSREILATDTLDAAIAGASLVSDTSMLNNVTADANNAELFAPVAALASAPGPTNPLANTNAVKVFVTETGIQQITGAALAAAGLTSPQASKLRVFHQGVELPLHIIDSNSNNVFNSDDSLRFYAPAAGDAWNAHGVYWLTTGTTNGLRMSERAVPGAGATARSTAYEVGRYHRPSIWESTLAGADGDNWFQANLRAESSDAAWDIALSHQLPLNDALPTVMTLHMTPYSIGHYAQDISHRLRASASGFNTTDTFTVGFTGKKPFEDMQRTLTLGKAADTWTLTLLKETTGRAIFFDTIDYLLPVSLNFGGKGATFQGVEGTWAYQLTNTPTNIPGGRGLYDITNPHQPQRLTIGGSASVTFQDGPVAHRYVMTGEGTLFAPTLEAHTAVNLGGAGAAHTIYIAPAEFHAALQPLVDLRKSQGYQVRVVDVQSIYDAWSFGMVDAEAIRSFLRFAVGNWSPKPIAAVLVGDGTSDPFNRTGGNPNNTPNVIPPYMANADPWLKYVACESCFGQLDGDDPSKDFLIDIWIGRFPVINEAELNTVVSKIVNYETNTDTHAPWRTTSVQIADDDVRPDNTVDTAGPFVGSAEHVISLMPDSVRQLRNYFMAATDLSNVPGDLLSILNRVRSWFISDADAALRRSIDLMNSGVGIVTYTGHSNHWQWARIVKDGDENRWLFGLIEVRELRNINSPFISMSMTCYTSQFIQPAALHYTLDERLFLHGSGGAISTWGPTGFSIVPAHDTMQVGFHELLWKSPTMQAKLGALYEAGYKKVFASGSNYDVNKTYAVFGDPLTSARVAPFDLIFMPKLER